MGEYFAHWIITQYPNDSPSVSVVFPANDKLNDQVEVCRVDTGKEGFKLIPDLDRPFFFQFSEDSGTVFKRVEFAGVENDQPDQTDQKCREGAFKPFQKLGSLKSNYRTFLTFERCSGLYLLPGLPQIDSEGQWICAIFRRSKELQESLQNGFK